MGFSFGGLNTTSTKKVLSADVVAESLVVENIVPGQIPYLVLLDEIYSDMKLKRITKFLQRNGIRSFRIVNALNVDFKKEDMTAAGGITRFYRANQSNWKKYVPGSKAILAVGASLYAINRSSDVTIDCFRDVVFNKTYFWSPNVKAWVYPIDSFVDLFLSVVRKDGTPANPENPNTSYRTRYAEWQLKQIQSASEYPTDIPEVHLVKIESREAFEQLCTAYEDDAKWPYLSWDLETSSLSFFEGRVGCLTMSFDGITGYYVPWHLVDKPAFNCLLAKKKQIGANLKFDCRFMWKNGVTNAKVWGDTLQLGHVINEQRYNGLKPSAYYYTYFGGYDFALDLYREKTGVEDFTAIPEHLLFEYATMDAIVAYQVYFAQDKQLTDLDKRFPNEKTFINGQRSPWTMRMYYENIMMPAVRAFNEIEYKGVYIDRAGLQASRAQILTEIDGIELELAAHWGVSKDFDFNSTQALGKLFERLGWEDLGRSKAGIYLTGDENLERWAQSHRPGADRLRRHRSLKAILKTFVSASEDAEKGWEQYLKHHEDGSWRIHPTFNVMRTETGRCRTDSPNMQNIPSHGDLAYLVKRCITTPDPSQFLLATVDYASLQARLATADTNLNEGGRDETLYSIYTDPKLGADLHSITAESVFARGKVFDVPAFIEVKGEDNITHKLDPFVQVTTSRGKLLAWELEESDELLAVAGVS